MDKDLTEKETLALLQAKNEIIALKKQFNQIQGDVQPQEYFFKFQKEIDLFEKKITKNIKTIETNSKFISIKKRTAQNNISISCYKCFNNNSKKQECSL